jgi:Na+-transporting methylmalonyl-CoA/oxaloacetate decarboxylase gamma subunit
MGESSHGRNNVSHRHEERDAQPWLLVMFGVGLVVMSLVVLLVADRLFDAFATRQARLEKPPPPLAETRPPSPEPRLQVAPAQDLQKMRAAEDAVLSSYGWVNRDAGIDWRPIDRAIELLTQRGLPVRQASQAPAAAEPPSPPNAGGS